MKKKEKNRAPVLERITDLYLAGMLTAFLLWPGSGGYAQITAHKATAYYWLTGIYLAALVLLRLEYWIIGKMGKPDVPGAIRKWSLPQWLILGYWLMTGISTLFSVDRATSVWGGPRAEGFLTISLYCASFLLVSMFGRARGWMLGLFGAAMSVNCVIALIQLAGYNPLGLYPEGMNYNDGFVRYAGQFLGTVGNVDLLSALLCVAIPVFWIGLLRLEGPKRFLLVVPLGLSLCVLGMAWVEGGVVGVLGSLILGLPVVLKTQKQRRIALAGAATAILFGLAGVYFLGGRFGGFVFEAHELMHGRFDEDFGSGRLYIWRETLKLVPERLLLGGGPETLEMRSDAAFERFDEKLGFMIRSVVDVAHNEYLNILVNQGLLALFCYLKALLEAAAGWSKEAAGDPAAAICGGAVLGYCIQAFFGISSPITAPFFWLVFALLVGRLQQKNA